jgi:hypothetical protein
VAATDTDVWNTRDTLMDEAAAAMPSEQRSLYDRHFVGMRTSAMSEMAAAPPEKISATARTAGDSSHVASELRETHRAENWAPGATIGLIRFFDSSVRHSVLWCR